MSESRDGDGPIEGRGAGDVGDIAGGERGSDRAMVFISHGKDDHGLAQEIRHHLRAGGFTAWMAPDDVHGPLPWPEQISRAIDNCDVMLVVVSAEANSSAHVSREVDLAVERGKPLLPVRVEDIIPVGALDYLLRLAQWIDLFPGSVADHAPSLQRTVGAMIGQAAPTAPSAAAHAEPPIENGKGRKSRILVIGVVVLLLAIVAGAWVVLSGSDDPEEVNAVETEADPASNEGSTVPLEGEGQDSATEDAARDADAANVDPADAGVAEPTTAAEPADGAAADAAPATTEGAVIRVSVSSSGAEANDNSANAALSANGQFVAFDSFATNLVENDAAGIRDVFVRDLETGETTRISETQTADGLAEANGASHHPRISADGRVVVFVSDATNLDPTVTDANGSADIYVHDRAKQVTTLVSLAPDGSQHRLHSIEPSISDDGTMLAYATYKEDAIPQRPGPQSGLFTAWVHDFEANVTTRLAEFSFADPHTGVCTRAGPRVAAGGSLAVADCGPNGAFELERSTSKISSVPVSGGNHFLTPSPDGDGIYLASQELWPAGDTDDGTIPWNIFVYERASNDFAMVGELNMSWLLDIWSISSDGQYLGVVAVDQQDSFNDMVVVNTQDGSTISLARDFGIPASGDGEDRGRLSLQGDGAAAAFTSDLGDLVGDDTNGYRDVFVLHLRD